MTEDIKTRSKVLRIALEHGEVNISALSSLLRSVEKVDTPTRRVSISQKKMMKEMRFERQLALLRK